MKVIAVANQKGGVGKTTSAIEIAACLTKREYKVLAIDLDQQANLTRYLGADATDDGIYKVLKREIKIKDAIVHTDEYDIIPSSGALSKASKEFGDAKDILLLRAVLRDIENDYDYVVIDCGPARDVLLNMSYIASDYIIIPAEAEEGSIAGIQAIFDDLQSYHEIGWSNAEVLGIILTKFEKTGMHSYIQTRIAEVLEENKSDAKVWLVRKSIAASEAKSEETSMQVGKKSSKPAIDYRTLTDEIIDLI